MVRIPLSAAARRAAVMALLLPCAARAQTSDPAELGTIDVIGVAPAQGGELPEDLLPYNVQRAQAGDFARAQALDATEYLDRRLAGVTIAATQSNPLQPDLQFRGFTASPLLGGAEGMSVFVDGVRVNEVFGDTVNWDLIPEEAMARLSLLAGADPVFGLNTLGGAILIQTKNGFTDPGTSFASDIGSFGRSETTAASGGNDGRWGWYALANHFEERGWRDLSASNAGTVLATASWRSDAASLDLHLAHAETKLGGNGAQAVEALALAPDSVFTAPDRTQNFFSGVTAQGTYALVDAVALSATAYLRQVDTRSYNGDVTDLAPCTDDAAIRCDGAGIPVRDAAGNTLPVRYDAINNIGVRKQRSAGVSLQATFKQDLFGRTNQFVAGFDFGRGRVDYRASTEASYLTPFAGDPEFTPVTAADTGVLLPADALAVHIAETNAGAYATDTLALTDALALTLSARWNRTRTRIADAGGNAPDLDGAHAFHRLNPAAGLSYRFGAALDVYGGYSESTRAPTPVELTCASPAAPCRLPNDFVADPPLRQVVARGVEAGLRGTLAAGALHWQAGVFRTVNAHDLVFQSTGGAQSNEGFFANVGSTRRQGAEIALKGTAFERRLDWYANYTRLDATFRSAFTEISAQHPFADPATGLIDVARGNRIPGVPRAALKLGFDWRVLPALGVGADIVYNSARYLRGDEANRLAPLGGYETLDLRASWRVLERVRVSARVQNAFDRRYANAGTLGDATALYPAFGDPRFVSPGAPRAGWVGFDLDW